ncbi:MAG: thermonuclease family protein [Actinobacteria bacterium]|nr:thermonuclease family protein [Actinomycetota bacterium]
MTAATRRVFLAVALVLSLGLAACARPLSVPAPADLAGPVAPGLPRGVDVAVERVIDGDTIVVSGHRHVRLIGVDTPETKDPRRPVGCYGKEASRFTTSLLPPGTAVRLLGDAEQDDQYGRLLAYVYRRADGLFVNAELVRRGYAVVLTIPPNVAHTDEFVALAADARAARRGLWSACPSTS